MSVSTPSHWSSPPISQPSGLVPARSSLNPGLLWKYQTMYMAWKAGAEAFTLCLVSSQFSAMFICISFKFLHFSGTAESLVSGCDVTNVLVAAFSGKSLLCCLLVTKQKISGLGFYNLCQKRSHTTYFMHVFLRPGLTFKKQEILKLGITFNMKII